jgi:hypothetical protein
MKWHNDWDGNEPIWTPDKEYETYAIECCMYVKNLFMETYATTKKEPENEGYIADWDDVDDDNDIFEDFLKMHNEDPKRFQIVYVTKEHSIPCAYYGLTYNYDHEENHDVFTYYRYNWE